MFRVLLIESSEDEFRRAKMATATNWVYITQPVLMYLAQKCAGKTAAAVSHEVERPNAAGTPHHYEDFILMQNLKMDQDVCSQSTGWHFVFKCVHIWLWWWNASEHEGTCVCVTEGQMGVKPVSLEVLAYEGLCSSNPSAPTHCVTSLQWPTTSPSSASPPPLLSSHVLTHAHTCARMHWGVHTHTCLHTHVSVRQPCPGWKHKLSGEGNKCKLQNEWMTIFIINESVKHQLNIFFKVMYKFLKCEKLRGGSLFHCKSSIQKK